MPDNLTSHHLTPLDRAIARFLREQAAYNAAATHRAYAASLGQFRWWVGHAELPPDPKALTADDLADYLHYCLTTPRRWGSTNAHAQRPMRPESARTYARQLRAFFNWLVEEGTLAAAPKIRLPKAPPPQIVPLTEDQIARILGACDPGTARGARDEALVWTLLASGMRLSEVCRLRVADYDPDTGLLTIQGAKGGGLRKALLAVLPARRAMQNWLTQFRPLWPQIPELLFVGLRGPAKKDPRLLTPTALTPDGLSHLLGDLMRSAGVEAAKAGHIWRHTCAVFRLMNGSDGASLQLLLGHKTFEMTQRYLHLQEEHQAVLNQRFAAEARIDRASVARYRAARKKDNKTE